jgi:phage I-like protein
MDELLKMLGVSTEAEAMRLVSSFNTFLSDCRSATGCASMETTLASVRSDAYAGRQLLAVTDTKTLGEAIGKVTAWKAGAADAEKARADLAANVKAQADASAKSTIDELCASGRLEPGKRGEFEALYNRFGVDALTAAASVLPQASAKTPGAKTPTPAGPAASSVLTAEERAVAALTGKTDEWMLSARDEATRSMGADGKTITIDAG